MNLVRFGFRMAIAALAAVAVVGMGGFQPALAATSAGQTVLRSAPSVFATIETPTWSSDGKTADYTISVANVGSGHADHVDVTIPLNKGVQLQNISFDNSQGRLTGQTASDLFASLGSIGSLENRKIKLTFGMPAGSSGALPIADRVTVSWRNNSVLRGSNVSNLPSATPANTPFQLAVAPSAGSSKDFGVSASAFVPGEPVTFWLNAPNGHAMPLYVDGGTLTAQSTRTINRRSTNFKDVVQHLSGQTAADAQGKLSMQLDDSGLPAGVYSLVARGYASRITAVGIFTVK